LVLRLLIKGNLEKELVSGKINHKREVARPPEQLCKRLNVDSKRILGRNVFTLSPKTGKSHTIILYLHGGAYVHGFARQHWDYMETMAVQLNCRVIAPDYPLAPDYNYQDSFAMLESIYKDLASMADKVNFIIMGDSAGAGFGLALAQKMKREGLAQPKHIVLLSPWLDISMTNPMLNDIEGDDPFLDTQGLKLAGEAYASSADVNDYLLSPINGDLEGLGKISVFTGTHDILNVDAKKLKELCEESGLQINYHEYEEMMHCWMLMGLKESKEVIRKVVEIIRL